MTKVEFLSSTRLLGIRYNTNLNVWKKLSWNHRWMTWLKFPNCCSVTIYACVYQRSPIFWQPYTSPKMHRKLTITHSNYLSKNSSIWSSWKMPSYAMTKIMRSYSSKRSLMVRRYLSRESWQPQLVTTWFSSKPSILKCQSFLHLMWSWESSRPSLVPLWNKMTGI